MAVIPVNISTNRPVIAANLEELRYLVFQGMTGDDGKSAYELAVELGFEGTEQEWLESLRGTDGADGFSPAVTITAITGGHRVTITDKDHPSGQTFDVMDGEEGAPGSPGAPGTPGTSPSVSVATITGGHRITITDAAHPQGQSIDVMDGTDYVLTQADMQAIAALVDTENLQTKAITDTGGYYTTDTVEGALQEIGAELAGINTLIGTGVIT